MSLIQVSSSQREFQNQNQGRTVFGISKGYQFKQIFDGSPLEIPPYSEIALHSGTFSLTSENVVVRNVGGDGNVNETGLRLVFCSNSATTGLSLTGQVTAPLSNQFFDGLDWTDKFTTKCPIWFKSPTGEYGNGFQYFSDLIKTLNCNPIPQFYNTFSVKEVNDATNGLTLNIINDARITINTNMRNLQGAENSGFINMNWNREDDNTYTILNELSLQDPTGGSGTNTWYNSVKKTAGRLGNDNPAVAQLNCKGILNGTNASVQCDGYYYEAVTGYSFATLFSQQSQHRAIFGLSKAGGRIGMDEGWGEYNAVAGYNATNPDIYEQIYEDAVDAGEEANALWAKFMQRCVLAGGNVTIQPSEVFEIAYMILPALTNAATNAPFNGATDYSKTHPEFKFEALNGGGSINAGFRYHILKLQFNQKYGYFYMPILTGDPIIGVGGTRTYNIVYSPQLNPGTNSDPKKHFGAGYSDESVWKATQLKFLLEGNLVAFLVDATIVADTGDNALYVEISDINYPLQPKWSITFGTTTGEPRGAKFVTHLINYVTGMDNLEPVRYYGNTFDDWDKYVNSASMIPNWIYNRQYWNPEGAYCPPNGYEFARTPNLILRSNDTDLFGVQTYFVDEEQTENAAKTGYWINNIPYIQLSASNYFDTLNDLRLEPNLLSQIGVKGLTTNLTPAALQGSPTGTDPSASSYSQITTQALLDEIELPFSTGLYIRLKNLPGRSSFGSINQTNDKLIAVINRFDNFYPRATSSTDSVYAFQEYERIYISLGNPAPIMTSTLEFEIVDRFGNLQTNLDKTVLVLHLRRAQDKGLYDYNRSELSLSQTSAWTL